jgi:hypothetical protein
MQHSTTLPPGSTANDLDALGSNLPASPALSDSDFDERLCYTVHRGVYMTVDEAYLEVLEEQQFRAENGPGAAYHPEEVDMYAFDEMYAVEQRP